MNYELTYSAGIGLGTALTHYGGVVSASIAFVILLTIGYVRNHRDTHTDR